MIFQRPRSGTERAARTPSFPQAIAKWARGYSIKYQHAPDPKPTVADALEDLRRWSASYWSDGQPNARLSRPLSEKGLHESLS